MKTCRKNNIKIFIITYRKLYKNKIYNYQIVKEKRPGFIYNYEIYELGTNQIIEIFSEEEFHKFFVDIQEERKLKLLKLNENRR